MQVPTPEEYLSPIKNATLEASFQAWQSLGNLAPGDDSSASAEVASCIHLGTLRSSAQCTGAGSNSSPPQTPESALLREVLGYKELLKDLTSITPAIKPNTVEKLLSVCTPENRRVARILSGLGCLMGTRPGEVPGLDSSATHLAAASFFLEVPDWKMAASLLAPAKWSLSHSYFLAGQILIAKGHSAPAVVAWEMGSGLGDEACLAHLVAWELLGGVANSAGVDSAQRFRTLHRSAERGYQLPLLAAAQALELGLGVDKDIGLASTYMVLAKLTPIPLGLRETARALLVPHGAAGREFRPTPGALHALLFNWASKHTHSPVHQAAAREWARLRHARL